MSDLLRLDFDKLEKPEFVRVEFSDLASRGLQESPQGSSRRAWVSLARSVSYELGIPVNTGPTEFGLICSFDSKSEADRFFQCIEADWQNALVLDSLAKEVHFTLATARLDTGDMSRDAFIRHSFEQIARQHDLKIEELNRYFKSDLDSFGVDMHMATRSRALSRQPTKLPEGPDWSLDFDR